MEYILRAAQLGVSSQSTPASSGTAATSGLGVGGAKGPRTDGGGAVPGPHTDAKGPRPDAGAKGPRSDGGGAAARCLALLFGCCCPDASSEDAYFPYPSQKQIESEWCWAAVAAGVDTYYRPLLALTQCEIASEVIPYSECCLDPDNWDLPEALDRAFAVIEHYRPPPSGPLSFQQVQAEIDASRPIGAQILWDDGVTSHYVTLIGYALWSSGRQTVDVADPFYSNSTCDFNVFNNSYKGSGTWGYSFFTKN